MRKELSKQYTPHGMEQKWYKFWQDEGMFLADENNSHAKNTYSIVMPPPNITGKLHLGHALDDTLQDILIRFKRMNGYETLWLPGTDHAAIATEAKIVAKLKEEGLTKKEIGREEFLKRAFAWKEDFGGQIIAQIKRLGCSCSWEHERFTMDDGCSAAVRHLFVDLFNRGLIYRGERIVNWCPYCKTSISDAEVDYVPKAGNLWYINYKVEGGQFITIATTRPETMLGDTAIAVNPKDERYADLVGKTAILPLLNRKIPIVADEYVEMEFGTGAVKITPAHDPNDFEVGQRHNLEIIKVMTEDGRINENGAKYAGLAILEARKQIIEDLKAEGVLVKTEELEHNVGICYRCGNVIEPLVSKQWFVKMKPLAQPAIDAVVQKKIKFVPERFSKIYLHWLENIKDWCISRQLWWGHRIPAYYCEQCSQMIVSEEAPKVCPNCQRTKILQDEDTLDTWFSAALWPFSTMGWPQQTNMLKNFFPTNTLVTAYDIIFFWVVRMAFVSLDQMKEIPFEYVYIHGLVRDAQGRKMSKSLGNGVDPLQVIEQNGADVLRMSLIIGNSPGNDIRFSDDKILLARNFANKIWNAARFVLMNISDTEECEELNPKALQIEDKWIITRLCKVVKEITANIEAFELGIALQKIYDFSWDVFCDWYIELAKLRLKNHEATVCCVLVNVLKEILKALHPFMPFITEEIWQALPHKGKSIMLETWGIHFKADEFKAEADEFEKLIAIIKAIRNARAQGKVTEGQKVNICIVTAEEVIKENADFITQLCKAKSVVFAKAEPEDTDGAIAATTDSARAFVYVTESVDKDKELAKLGLQLEALNKEYLVLQERLSNPGFLNKAPKAVIDNYIEQKEKLAERIANVKANIKKYS